jgi:hypothetical protein
MVGTMGARRTSVIGLVVAVLVAMTVLFGPVSPAWATCGDSEVTRTYNGTGVNAPLGFYMGASYPKQNVGCYDGNVRYAFNSMNHRGQWWGDGGGWNWSSVGAKWINAGTQSPVVKLIAGPITVGRSLRIGATVFESWGRWWF